MLEHDLGGELGEQAVGDDVFFPLVLEFDDRKFSRYSGFGCTRTKSCGPGLRTGTVVKSFFTPAVSLND